VKKQGKWKEAAVKKRVIRVAFVLWLRLIASILNLLVINAETLINLTLMFDENKT